MSADHTFLRCRPWHTVWEWQMPPRQVQPVTSPRLSHLSRGISSLLPCPFQISRLHPHPPWSLLTGSHVSSLIHLFPIS